MNEQEFVEQYESILFCGLSYGVANSSVSTLSFQNNSISDKEQKEFIRNCHRGFDKAQVRAVELIQDIVNDTEITKKTKERWILLVRKIIDGIAFTLLKTETHVARRLSLHEYVQMPSIECLKRDLEFAREMNSRNRLSFTLLNDLTTFIHVGDVVNVDFSKRPVELKIVELKTGKTNKILLDKLKDYKPEKKFEEEGIGRVAEIDSRHKAQAQRMLKQELRLSRAVEAIRFDVGFDISTQKPVKHSKEYVYCEHYDDSLGDLIKEAMEKRTSVMTIDDCIHLGCGWGENFKDAKKIALNTLNEHISKRSEEAYPKLKMSCQDIFEEIPEKKRYHFYDVVKSNLEAIPSRPLTIWGFDRIFVKEIIKNNICIMGAFDVISFIHLIRSLGIDLTLTTRKETERLRQEFGRKRVITWNNRALRLSHGGAYDNIMFSNLFLSFIVDLILPAHFMKQVKDMH